ncbi:hypothetical protein O0Q50_20850 [Priestia aryabhattai]|uniref:Uncharacterized protein n=1 Tax=Priestia aryabhattai TaxID=412384 RepID=A0AAX6NCV5_PRIAR|nr:hypothetical protein [Priestia aryabhattai]MDU9693627.1 hypothetical protein [Priestia aryabhattai]
MSKKRILFISLGWLTALAFLFVGITYSANKEEMETNKWLEQAKKETYQGTVNAYKVKRILSVKSPLTDELDSISEIFFDKKVDLTKIKVIEAIVETSNNERKVANIVTEIKDSKSVSSVKSVSGILIKGKNKGGNLIVYSQLKND